MKDHAMKTAFENLTDQTRLEVVKTYLESDTAAFDRAARAAARATSSPFALVYVATERHLHLKGSFGIEIGKVEHSLPDPLAHVLPSAFVQTNDSNDLYAWNAMFASKSGWQKYHFAYHALVALRGADGHVLGAVSVLDEELRELQSNEIAALEDIAEALIFELDLKAKLERNAQVDLGLEGSKQPESAESEIQVSGLQSVEVQETESQPEAQTLGTPDVAALEQELEELKKARLEHVQSENLIRQEFQTAQAQLLELQELKKAQDQALLDLQTQLAELGQQKQTESQEFQKLQTQFEALQKTQSLKLEQEKQGAQVLHSAEMNLLEAKLSELERKKQLEILELREQQMTQLGELVQLKKTQNNELQEQKQIFQNQKDQELGLLQHQLEHSKSLLQQLPLMVFAVDSEGVFTTCEGEAFPEFQIDPKKLLGSSIFKSLEAFENLQEAICQALLGEQVNVSIQTDGRSLECRVHGVREGINVNGATGVLFDVTKRAHNEHQHTLLEAAILASTDSVIITDADLELPGPQIVYVNPAFTQMSGYAKHELIGQTPRILQGLETDRELMKRLRSTLHAGKSFADETTNYRKDGTPYFVEWRISPIQNSSGKITHYVSIQRDITERKRITKVLQEVESIVAPTNGQRLSDSLDGTIVVADRNEPVNLIEIETGLETLRLKGSTDGGFQGRLEDVGGAAALVQMLMLLRPTGSLRINENILYLRMGRVVHLEPAHENAREVVIQTLQLERGRFHFDGMLLDVEETLDLEPNNLVFEAARRSDELIRQTMSG
jgi:PAS domain S-box-containing protein